MLLFITVAEMHLSSTFSPESNEEETNSSSLKKRKIVFFIIYLPVYLTIKSLTFFFKKNE